MNNGKFIVTTDVETKEYLIKLGYQLVNNDNNIFYFLNDGKFVCSEKDKHFSYTNVFAI